MSLSLRVDNSKKSCFFCSLKFLLWDYGELNTRLVLCRVNLDQNFKFVASQPNTVNGVWEGNQTSRGRYLIGKPARQVNGICRPVHSSLPSRICPPSDIPLLEPCDGAFPPRLRRDFDAPPNRHATSVSGWR